MWFYVAVPWLPMYKDDKVKALLCLQQMCGEVRPSLSLDQQLCWHAQPQCVFGIHHNIVADFVLYRSIQYFHYFLWVSSQLAW